MAKKFSHNFETESRERSHSEYLLPVVYDSLRQLASRRMINEPPGHTLQATALVHEAYLRLVNDGCATWNDPAHFYGAAAEAMRRILVERARRYRRLKHGAGLARIPFDKAEAAVVDKIELLDLDEALTRLEKFDARKADVVKLRYFVGFTIAETADLLGISPATVKLDWSFARAWLQKFITENQTA